MPRAADFALALVAAAVLAPLAAAIALAIRLADGKPVLFRQERVGRGGRSFTLIKFRTLRAASGGAPVTAANDSRITALGGFLRRRRWDELPQLWNILRGEMSWVGPRPELPIFVALFPAEYAELLRRPPGLVDPATLAWAREDERLAAATDFYATYVGEVLPAKLRLARAYALRRTAASDLALVARALRLALLP